jgi:predicted O-methyltransferase YrrM
MIGSSFLHLLGVMAGAEKPHTQTTPEERGELLRWLPGAKTIVEIGVYEGATTSLLAAHADVGAVVYGVDPFFHGRLGVCWGEAIARSVNRRKIASGSVKLVKKFSYEAVPDVPMPVDFIFVDGDHSLEGIKRDWETWAPLMRPGAIFALHDSYPAPHSPGPLGSHTFFADTISKDPRYVSVAKVGSLAILKRLGG